MDTSANLAARMPALSGGFNRPFRERELRVDQTREGPTDWLVRAWHPFAPHAVAPQGVLETASHGMRIAHHNAAQARRCCSLAADCESLNIPASLPKSPFAALEPPQGAIEFDIAQAPPACVREIEARLGR